jgi:exopolysaccharide biosynthesis polyprenyl glycosylphosphotransferase
MPISRKDSFTIQVYQLTDSVLVWVAFWCGSLLRDAFRGWASMDFDADYAGSVNWILYIAVPFTPLVLERFGFYDHLRHKTLRTAVWQLFRALAVIVLMIGIFAVFAKMGDARRLSLAFGLALMFLSILGRDRLLQMWFKKQIRSESNKESVIIAGSGDEMAELVAELDPEITADWKIVDLFDLSTRDVNDLFDLLKDESVSRVLFAAKNTEFEKVARAVEACELQGVEAWIAASFIRSQIARPVFDAVGNRPMLVLRTTPELSWELLCKGVFDIGAAIVLLIISSPLWIFAIVGIRLSSPGAPVFFWQQRAGRYGKPFRMLKFRTMVPNAEALLEQTKEEHGNQMQGPVFKLDNDPRVFPFGAMLRKLSIDELPQLLNVLNGTMSLVGPRPLPIYEVAAFCELSHRRRLSVKPGITCEWQAGGRNRITSFEEWVAMDLEYIDNWSLWLDFQILVKTVPAVLFGKGAR